MFLVKGTDLDFRSSERVHYVKTDLPDEVHAACVTLVKVLGLNFSCIDLRRTPDGEYVFFEGNPSPVFIHFEEHTGYPVGDRLIQLLMSPMRN